ncbi:hypothetical protein D3C81_2017810 [compost metagenome]
MSTANGAEGPRAGLYIAIRLHIRQTIHINIILIQVRVLGMEMMDRASFTKNLDRAYRIDALPPQMARV